MTSSTIHLQWDGLKTERRFRTGVSLHSHTLHSRESLTFIYRAAARVPLLAAVIRRQAARYREIHGTHLDLSRGWWTPPLGPREAWSVECEQIHGLGLSPVVSLTDHDDIEAPVSLQVLNECCGSPISFEWTVPYGPTFFHLGIHNLPVAIARSLFERLAWYTNQPEERRLEEILTEVSRIPGTLVVFNHPLWDESGAGPAAHQAAAREFAKRYALCIHAMEINGLRPWRENQGAIALAASVDKPAISGGDRHALEPNAVLNLTNAGDFSEFADEVRSGWSDVLIMPHYRQNHAMRIVHNMIDVLTDCEQHANGWRVWSDRVFYICDDGRTRSLTELFGSSPPAPVAVFIGALRIVSAPGFRRLLREAFPEGEGIVL